MKGEIRMFVVGFIVSFVLVTLLLHLFIPSVDNYSDEDICQAIYKAEGAEKAKVPYGILSVKCEGEQECKQICLNTVKNNRKRYKDYGYKDYDTYLEFLASRYAPVEAHPLNKNWLKNVKYFLKKGGGK